MLFIRVKTYAVAKLPRSVVRLKKRNYSVSTAVENEETTVQYPPILDTSIQGHKRRLREKWAEIIAQARTVEEKMIKINMPRYYGFRLLKLQESIIPYNSVDQMQYFTKTHVPTEPGLPAYYNNLVTPERMKAAVEKIRGSIEDGLVFEYANRKRDEEWSEITTNSSTLMDNVMSKVVSKQVHRCLMSHVATDNHHLMETEIDWDPRIEAFWFVGGLPPPAVVRIMKLKQYYPKDFAEASVDRAVQYIGQPNFQLRHRFPLPEVIPISESENPDFTIPVFKYEPRTLGFSLDRRHGTNIPGFWPGDKSEFGFLSYHKCGHLAKRRFNDQSDALKVQAVLGSWSWLLSQACNLGFSPFNDITYPLTNQMIITNGKWWTFCVYQLNTILLHSHHLDEGLRRNICWMTEPMALYEKIEDDKVHGLNDVVLEHLVKFYANKPCEREGVDMKPYLHTGEGIVANITGPMRRAWLEERFKLLVSNRPRHRELPEVYDWENIYMRKHQMRPLDAKRKPWQLGINPWHKKLDCHLRRYIPRAVRGGKKGIKYIPTFYP